MRAIRFIASVFSYLRAIIAQNPILSRELVRFLRQPRSFVLLAAILTGASLLLVWMWHAYRGEFDAVGRQLFYATVGGQALALVLLLPGYAAQSFILEREQNTLNLLLSTPLGPERIVAGKLISVMGVMGLIVIGSYPLITVSLARGGVSPWEVIAAAVGLLWAAFVIASFSIYFSLVAKTLFRSILLTHLTMFSVYFGGMLVEFFIVAGGAFILSLLMLIAPGFQSSYVIVFQVIIAAGLFPFLFVIPAGMFFLAAGRLRDYDAEVGERGGYEDEPFQLSQQRRAHSGNGRKAEWEIPDGVNPFYVREKAGNKASSPFLAMPSWYFTAIIVYHLCLLAPLHQGRWMAAVVLALAAQMAGAYASRTFAGEREAETWDLLASTTFDTTRLVYGKYRASLQPCLTRAAVMMLIPAALFLAIDLMVMAFSVGTVMPRSVPLLNLLAYFVVIVSNVALLCALGIWFSARSARTANALMWTYGLAILYFLLPLFAMLDSDTSWLAAFSPFMQLIYAFNPDSPQQVWFYGVMAGQSAICALGVLFLLRLSCRAVDRARESEACPA